MLLFTEKICFLVYGPKKKTKNNPKCSISYLLSNGVFLKCKTPSYGSVELVLGYLFSWGYLWRLRVLIPQIMGKETSTKDKSQL